MRPSSAGPMEAPPAQASSAVLSVLKWRMPPTEMTFFAQAWGRESWFPLFDCEFAMAMSRRQTMSSIWCEMLV